MMIDGCSVDRESTRFEVLSQTKQTSPDFVYGVTRTDYLYLSNLRATSQSLRQKSDKMTGWVNRS